MKIEKHKGPIQKQQGPKVYLSIKVYIKKTDIIKRSLNNYSLQRMR